MNTDLWLAACKTAYWRGFSIGFFTGAAVIAFAKWWAR